MPQLDLLQGTLDLLILKTLTQGPLHGYAIVRHIQKTTADTLLIKEGSLYPALHRLERRGWVRAEWRPSENNRRAKFYCLTRAARRHMEEEESAWSQFSEAVAKVLRAAQKGAAG
ncbi:MAG TPA: PadR family transcriptional regulator [Candidatus Acidoferrales bacterium]